MPPKRGDIVGGRDDAKMVEVGLERASLRAHELITREAEPLEKDELEQQCAAHVAEMVDGNDEPGTQRGTTVASGPIDRSRWTGVAGLSAAGFDQAKCLEAFESAVDELARQAPDIANRCAWPKLGRDVIAVPGSIDEHA